MSENIIDAQSEVIMHFDLKLEDGSAADSTRINNKPAKLVMGDGSLTPNFEACLLGLKKGEKKAFTLCADDAFGQPNPDNVHHMERSRFSHDLELVEGTIVAFSQPDGSEVPGIVRSVAGDSVTVDFNHPLAGQTVIFDVEIIDVLSTEAKD
ncbi:FKBP-type peptidyl-prolyl cis-trans isomerase [Alteromonas sp. C1M14]|uniref:FKBP-type peptidyl-prolyl cis-trans isomerase n=1 Tax=Alteromonas sp. C1M14 TaxID=2841567 RepID=UPI001C09DAE9|nr:FKBP-type peptidyl-prolyl cis-trans isomerase [Alteromonas sp. C1M14]MBU2979106.1 FKBP-type peptidyl-prolyl cis-trans isomerase [Alteromonas sp. C1M14]